MYEPTYPPLVPFHDIDVTNLQVQVINIMNQAMYPVACLVDLSAASRQILADLQQNALYAHTFHYIAHTYSSTVQDPDPFAMGLHMQHALQSLQSQLEDAEAGVTDSTLLASLMLGMISEVIHDSAATHKHLSGLSTLIGLRGGLSHVMPLLQVKACRLDLRFSLRTSSEPLLASIHELPATFRAAGLIPRPGQPSPSPIEALCGTNCSKGRLQTAYDHFRAFSQQLNLAFQANRRVSPVFFQHALIDTSYGLLDLGVDDRQACGCEAVRLGMLALSTSILLGFQDDVRNQHEMLAASLRNVFRSLTAESRKADDANWAKAALWLTVVATLTVLYSGTDAKVSRDLVKVLCGKLGITSWAQIRAVVKEFTWVDAVLDRPGEDLWEAIGHS